MTMDQLLIPLATFLFVVCVGGAFVLVQAGRKKTVVARLQALEGSGEGVAQRPSALAELLGRLGAMTAMGRPSIQLKQELARAGIHAKNGAEVFLGIKALLLVVGLGGAIVAATQFEMSMPMVVLTVIGGAAVGVMTPNLVLARRKRARSQEIRSSLPDAIDLIEICVSSGMGVDQAWNSTADEVRDVSPALADEMSLTNMEILLGASRPDALKHMSDRTGADELGALSTIIAQSEKFGTSMAEAMRVFSEDMRQIRSQRAEESAEKMSVKLMVPLVLFIFPAIFIVTAGPAALKLIEIFSE